MNGWNSIISLCLLHYGPINIDDIERLLNYLMLYIYIIIIINITYLEIGSKLLFFIYKER